MDNLRNVLSTILIILAFLAIGFFAVHVAKKVIKSSSREYDDRDFFISGVECIAFNRDGNLFSKIEAKRAVHFGFGNILEFEFPRIRINDLDGQVWSINAGKGELIGNGEKIALWEKVEIDRKDNRNCANLKITTDSVEYYPGDGRAWTPNCITVKEIDNITNAIGAEVDFKRGEVKLLSDVESEYRFK